MKTAQGARPARRLGLGLGLLIVVGCAHGSGAAPAEGPGSEAAKTVATAEGGEGEAPPAPEEMTFESYQLVLLRAGPMAEEIPEAELEEIQRAHRAHLRRMGEEGHMVVAGPFSDQPDETLRGLCLYRTPDIETARRLAESDPAVQAGRLRVEVMTWWTQAGAVAFPMADANAKGP